MLAGVVRFLGSVFLLFCLFGSAHAQSDAGEAPVFSSRPEGKVLVTFNALPPAGTYELVGPISVVKRWFGGTGQAIRLLGQKARELGANAVVETGVWLAPAFPVMVAPHGRGVAIRVLDPEVLAGLADQHSSWE